MRHYGIKGAIWFAAIALAGSAFAKGEKDTTTLDVGTVTTSTKDVTPLQKIKVGFLSETYIQARGPNTGNYSTFQAQNNVNVAYELSPNETVQLRQYAHYNMTDGKQLNEWGIGDLAVQYNRTAVQIGAAPVDTYARLYLPIEQYTNQVGKYELRLQATATQAISSNLNLTYTAHVRGYGYTKEQQGQRSLRAMPGMTLGYAPTGLFQPYLTVYEDSSWRFNSNGNQGLVLYDSGFLSSANAGDRKHYDVNTDSGYADIGSKININKNVKLDAFYEAEANWHNPDGDAWDNGSYQVSLSVSM